MVTPVCDLLGMKRGRAQSTCVIATGRVAAYLLTSMVLIASLEVQMVATKKKSVEKAVAGASQEVLVAKIAKPAAEHSNAVKADAEQFKEEKSVTERTAEDAVVEASQIKHVAVERSSRMQTPQLPFGRK